MFTPGKSNFMRSAFARCCTRSYSSAPLPKKLNAKEVIKKQLRRGVEIPKAKTWSKTAVLEALDSTVEFSLKPDYFCSFSPQYWGKMDEYSFKGKARKSGIKAANYVISKQRKLFEHDWDADDVEEWLKMESDEQFQCDPLDEDGNLDTTIDSGRKNQDDLLLGNNQNKTDLEDSVESLRILLERKEPEKCATMFLSLRKNDVEVPESLTNQLIGFLAFTQCSSTVWMRYSQRPENVFYSFKPFSENFSMLQDVLNAAVPQTPEHLMSFVRSCVLGCKKLEALQIFEKHFKTTSESLDLDTYNAMVLTGRAKHYFLQRMKNEDILPNEHTFTNLFHNYDTLTPEKLFQHWSIILNEAKALGIDATLSMYAGMVYVSGNLTKQLREQIRLAIVKDMLGKQFEANPHEVAALDFIQKRVGENLETMKILWEVVTSKNNYQLLSQSTLEYKFLYRLLLCSMDYDTMANTWSMVTKLIPLKFFMNGRTKTRLINCIMRNEEPQYLPATYALYINSNRDGHETLLLWLQTALKLAHCADKDTQTELANIASDYSHHVYQSRLPDEKAMLMNCSVQLLAKVGTVSQTTNYIKMCIEKFGEIRISGKTMKVCKEMLEQHPDSTAMQKVVESMEKKWQSDSS